jgi:hypothetical protein
MYTNLVERMLVTTPIKYIVMRNLKLVHCPNGLRPTFVFAQWRAFEAATVRVGKR